jgi:cell shape-determining protein MreC
MNTFIIISSLWLSISLVMGIFAITQKGYQDRMSPLEQGMKSVLSFFKGFISWPVLFPIGIAKSKYKCKTIHKVSTGKSADTKR